MTVPAGNVKFFRGSGTTYTGSIPSGGSYGYGGFIVIVRSSGVRLVVGVPLTPSGGIILNYHNGTSWAGWERSGCAGDSLGTTSSYVKYSNGLMIQWGQYTVTGSTTAQGYTYFKAIPEQTLPQTFVNQYFTVTGSSRYSTGASMPIGCYPTANNKYAGYLYDTVARSSVSWTVRWQAIGRWK